MSNIQIPNNMEEVLKRLGACGMGYPDLGMPCIRPEGHNPFHDCFALVEELDGKVWGIYMQQDGKDWVNDPTKFPTDLVVSTPLFKKKKTQEQVPDRRGLVAHTKGKS